MRKYKVEITARAERRIEKYLAYLINEKNNMQAAIAVSDDYDETVSSLVSIAGSLWFCDDEDLKKRGIKKILFKKHDYLLLYRIVDETAYIESVYHARQDYENLFKSEPEEDNGTDKDFN